MLTATVRSHQLIGSEYWSSVSTYYCHIGTLPLVCSRWSTGHILAYVTGYKTLRRNIV